VTGPDPEWVTKAQASRRSAAHTANGQPVPESTIRSWTKPTSARGALLRTDNTGRFVHWPTVKELAAKFRPRGQGKDVAGESVPMKRAEFAHIVGIAAETASYWKKNRIISDYCQEEADRMIAARITRDNGGPGLEEQAKKKRALEEVDELGIEHLEIDEATSGQLRAERLKKERAERLEFEGHLFRSDDVHAALEQIVSAYRDALNRGTLQILRALHAVLDQHAVQLPTVAMDQLQHTVADILTARAADARAAIQAQRDARRGARRS
jgi:hypothetical protein